VAVDGLESLRMKRRARTIAPPKQARGDTEPVAGRAAANVQEAKEEPAVLDEETAEQMSKRKPKALARPKPNRVVKERKGTLPMADERDYANLAVRVRRSLDRRAARLVSTMAWDHNFKVSKADLIELLLWELPDTPTEDLMGRLRAFKEQAPRP
jgi:hypothetical protein